jgi:hypothetical protein
MNDYQVDNTGAIAEDCALYLGVHVSSLYTYQEKTLIAIKDRVSLGNSFWWKPCGHAIQQEETHRIAAYKSYISLWFSI